eukprot:TRINITY_DN9561_c0_g2_i1.p1 TRINITY_DN9561_c0_g2~~TRINITY_DN9561_c0_g2_i1.p1  ORF type:complete len:251 (-),score=65.81 TRINITY_DN9561_c0_g2_i1:54-806(-)
MANMSILYLLALSLSVLAKHTANKRDSYIEERIPMTEEERQEHLNKFLEEWGQHMVDFIPSDMLAFEILAGRSRTIYENVKAAPILFRGAYSVSAEDSYKLGATIYDPQGNIIFSKKHAREAIIYLFLNVTGTYTIVFENKNYYSSEEVQFSTQISKVNASYAVIVEDEHYANRTYLPIEKELSAIEKGLSDVTVQQRFLNNRKERQNRHILRVGRRSLYITVVESIGVICITIWQVYYIKKLLDAKHSV